MNVQAIKCDICGRVKGESNHWFAATVSGESVLFYPASKKTNVEGEADLCGAKCAHSFLDKFLSEGEAA